MTSLYIAELPSHVGEAVTVRGWVATIRSSGKVAFLVLRDGTGLLQCVLSKADVAPEAWETFRRADQESSVTVSGSVRGLKWPMFSRIRPYIPAYLILVM